MRSSSKSDVKKDEPLIEELDEYLKKHLKEYILFNLGQGYEMPTIVDCLKKQGYHVKQLRSIIEELPTTKHKVNPPQYTPTDLSKDTVYYLEGILKEYIGNMIEHGYDRLAIKHALINYGHHPAMVQRVFTQIKPEKKVMVTPDVAIFGGFIVYGILSVLLMLELGAPSQGALLFIPGGLGIIVTVFLFRYVSVKKLVPLIQIFLVVLFYFGVISLLNQQMIDLSSFDIESILGINVIMSTIISVFITLVLEKK